MSRQTPDGITVFLNPCCRHHSGISRWEAIRNALRDRIGDFRTVEIVSTDHLHLEVLKAVEQGSKTLIAAGGDGTVNLLLNEIMSPVFDRHQIIIGAVGLGSSNDFHKPFAKEKFICGMPVRVDGSNTLLCDVIQIDYQNTEGRPHIRYGLNNASIGLTAEANALFNSRTKWLETLKSLSVNTAILAAAMKTILDSRSLSCVLKVGHGTGEHVALTNLGIVKNPHFAGSLCYDCSIQPGDGMLGVTLCEDLSKTESLGMLVALSRRRFHGLPKTRFWKDSRVSVQSSRAFALEIDGEVVWARNALFQVLPQAVRCCQ
jgi:diacylglycerol kinase (ATP)